MFEYKAIPAPPKGKKQRGLKTAQDRFAKTFSDILNAEAQSGWDYLGIEKLPSEERSGFFKSTIVEHNMMLFRRPSDASEKSISAPKADPAAVRPVEESNIKNAKDPAANNAPSLPSASAANQVDSETPAIDQ